MADIHNHNLGNLGRVKVHSHNAQWRGIVPIAVNALCANYENGVYFLSTGKLDWRYLSDTKVET